MRLSVASNMELAFLNKLDLAGRYNKLKPRERSLLFGFSIVALLLVSDFAVVRPLWNYYVSIEERTAAEEKRLVRNLLNINRKDAVERDYAGYQQFTRPSGTDEEEIGKLLSEIEQTARTNKVVLVDMKPREAQSRDFYKEYRAELDAETELANWVQFVHQLEESEQLLRVSAAKLTLKTPDSSVVKARMTVTKIVLLEKS